MIRRLRVVVLLARPAVLLLLCVFAALGMALTGTEQRPALLGCVVLSVIGFLLFSVVLNDLADEPIDRVNVPGDRRRPLLTGAADRHEMFAVAGGGAVVALASAALLSWQCAAVVLVGMALSAAYSLHPVRLAERGAVASLVLPACYVAVPFLLGLWADHPALSGRGALLLGGLYVGFVGRILLKDFRDVRGDALFGKRTFLVRHGRGPTCLFSAVGTAAGTGLLLAGLPGCGVVVVVSIVGCLAVTLVLLWLLAGDAGPRRDESVIAGIAILGRGALLLTLTQLAMVSRDWPTLGQSVALSAIAVVTIGQAISMVRTGPYTRLRAPVDLPVVELHHNVAP
ncbi:MAG: UbiA family prenyltransferase [Jatrophihabitans sp.]